MTTDSSDTPFGGGGLGGSLAREAARLWEMAGDRSRWGFCDEAADLRRLAISKRVQSMLELSLQSYRSA